MSAITQTHGLCKCGVPQKVARQRGSKVRMQCPRCLRLSKWQSRVTLGAVLRKKLGDTDVALSVKHSTKNPPLGPLVSLPSDSREDQARAALFTKTVTQLKATARDIGIKGYSKMTKSELVDSLTKAAQG